MVSGDFRIFLVIPAFNPGSAVSDVVAGALRYADVVVLVDDGCSPEEKHRLKQCCADGRTVLLEHAENMGKGFALYTGIRWCLERMGKRDFILCMDSDGQHRPEDIPKFRALVESGEDVNLALGERKDSGVMPWKSRLGNGIARSMFRLQYGGNVFDTQTGFRLLSAAFAAMCIERVRPGRFETEMKMLILAVRVLPGIHSVGIPTIYLDGNRNTRFKPLGDSWRIMRLFVCYMSVSLLSFLVDYLLFVLLLDFAGVSYLGANVSARAFSATFNFLAHKEFSFQSPGGLLRKALAYTGAVLLSLCLGSMLLYIGVEWGGINAYIAKPAADVLVFVFNFFVLSRLVFSEAGIAR